MGKTFYAFWLGIVFCFSSIGVEAYVMPPEQLIEYMQDRFGVYKTMVIGQKTVAIDPLDGKETNSSEEKIWVKTPGFFKSQVISGQGRGAAADEPFTSAFRQLLMGNSNEYLLMLLAKFGIDIESSGYTRLDGIVAYYIGYREPGSARLLLDKKTFLPILLEYEMRDNSGQKKVSIRFEEYREISGGWYPFKIGYFEGEEVHEQYTVLDLQINMPLSSGMFRQRTVVEKPLENNSRVDDEHLSEAINALKNKYK
jgi:hypothetical protein